MEKRNRYLLNFIIILVCTFNFSQNTKLVSVDFIPLYNKKPLLLNQNYLSEIENEEVSFSIFKFYASNFEFYHKGKLVYPIKDSYFLVDVSDQNSLKRELSIPSDCDFDEIQFYLGIDHKTNFEGIGKGDLDPTKGMYWAWQSGYINMKLEGKCKSIENKTNSFQFHFGGFLEPFSCYQKISLNNIENKNTIVIYTDLFRFLSQISLKEFNNIMSPNKNAVILSKKASAIFHL